MNSGFIHRFWRASYKSLFKIICKHFLYIKYQVRGNKILAVALISYASYVASDSCSIWLFITGLKVITRHQKTFLGCSKFLLSLLKPASLKVLTSGHPLQQTPAAHWHLSSAECPQQITVPDTAEAVYWGDPSTPLFLSPCTLGAGEICTCYYIQKSCTQTISARSCWKRYPCWTIPRDMVVSIL